MIKFMTDGDQPLLGLGLSTGNLKQLANGHPIKINADELATGHDIIIFWGPTEIQIAEKMHELGLIPTDYYEQLIEQLRAEENSFRG